MNRIVLTAALAASLVCGATATLSAAQDAQAKKGDKSAPTADNSKNNKPDRELADSRGHRRLTAPLNDPKAAVHTLFGGDQATLHGAKHDGQHHILPRVTSSQNALDERQRIGEAALIFVEIGEMIQ